jgi:FkbM family methyltransferase
MAPDVEGIVTIPIGGYSLGMPAPQLFMETAYRSWWHLARRMDNLPGVQGLRTLMGLDSWRDRLTFGRWVVERRLGIPYRESSPSTDPTAVIMRDGYRFEPREGTADRSVLGPFNEVQTRTFVRRQLARRPACGVFIDVGAHCGSFSIPFESFFERVLAIEPLPDNYRALERNIALNGLAGKIRPFNFAAAEAGGPGTLFLDGDEKSSLFSTGHSSDSVGVTLRSLDDLLNGEGVSPADVRLLKVDVEGAELRVLAGARRLLSEGSAIVVLEANTAVATKDLQTFMDGIGYVELRVADGRNLFFRRPPER